MKTIVLTAALAVSLVAAAAVSAAPQLKPASKQSGMKSGLSVRYAWAGNPPSRIQSISEAISMLGSAKSGAPLRGLDYRDTNEGDPVLTHKQHYNVAADISGYIRFDSPGVYELETWSNDGIDARIGGQSVGRVDGRQGCEANQRVTVEVPQAGWYDLRIRYFQKYGTSCLMMKWGRQGQGMQWVPNSAFGR